MSSRATVVVAEDHSRIRDTLTLLLSRHFDVVAQADNGVAAVDTCLRYDPDVIVLDIAMPELDGLQAASQIRAAGSAARIVFLSNHTRDEFVRAALTRDGTGFVAKSRMHVDLIPAIRHCCAGRRFVPTTRILSALPREADHRHHVQFCATDALLLSSLWAYFDAALRAGDAAVAVAPEAHLRELEARLGDHGLDMAGLRASGRYVAVDADAATAAMVIEGIFDPQRFTALFGPIVDLATRAAIGPLPHVAGFGEIAPGLVQRGLRDAALAIERTTCDFVATRPVSVLCAYAEDVFSDDDGDYLASVCASHETIVAPPRR